MQLSPVDRIVLAGFLKRYVRVGYLFEGKRESVAAHSFRTAYIAWEIGRMRGEGGRHARVALWHDFHESVVLDASYIGLRYMEPGDGEIARSFGVPEQTEVARDADMLELLATAWEWGERGRRWVENALGALSLPESRRIAEQILSYENTAHFYASILERVELGPAERIVLAGILKRLPRSGWLAVGMRDPETVGEHVFRVAIIADMLAEAEGEDPEDAVVRALLHDLPESIVGDQHKLAKIFRHVREEAVWHFLGLKAPEMGDVVRDADLLELLATIWEYEGLGVRGLEGWKEIAVKGIRTETGREWAEEILSLPPPGEYYVDLLQRLGS